MEGSETLASPSAEVWISFLFPHHSILTSSVFHFYNDYQVQGQKFSSPFLPSGNADSSICEKCPCVFEFGLRYLTSASACSNSSHSRHWVTPEPGISSKEAIVWSYLREICMFGWTQMNNVCHWTTGLTKNMQIVLFIAFRRIYIVFSPDYRSYLPFSKHNFSKQTTVYVLFGYSLVW